MIERAVALGSGARPLRLSDIFALHRVLMLATTTPQIAGEVRDRQNWIGGNAYNPGRADFVPPPPELVKGLMGDLVAFVNRTDFPPVVQAAVAHAQFETIHPFADGNGRVGRALIHVVLRRRGLAQRYVPPVSLVLAADATAYVAGLTAFREDRAADWILLFAQALERAAAKASELALRLAELQEKWRESAGRPRRHSSAEALIVELPAHPIRAELPRPLQAGRKRGDRRARRQGRPPPDHTRETKPRLGGSGLVRPHQRSRARARDADRRRRALPPSTSPAGYLSTGLTSVARAPPSATAATA